MTSGTKINVRNDFSTDNGSQYSKTSVFKVGDDSELSMPTGDAYLNTGRDSDDLDGMGLFK